MRVMSNDKDKNIWPKFSNIVKDSSDSKIVELLAKLEKEGATKEFDFSNRKATRTVHYPVAYDSTAISIGTDTTGSGNYIDDLVGPCDLPYGFAQFRAAYNSTTNKTQSAYGKLDMGSPVGGEVWVAVKHGQISPPSPNPVSVYGWVDIGGYWEFIGVAAVTAGYTTNGSMVYVANTPSFKYYRYFAMGTVAMGGSNLLGHIWPCAFMVID
jgi:hypothetical protein